MASPFTLISIPVCKIHYSGPLSSISRRALTQEKVRDKSEGSRTSEALVTQSGSQAGFSRAGSSQNWTIVEGEPENCFPHWGSNCLGVRGLVWWVLLSAIPQRAWSHPSEGWAHKRLLIKSGQFLTFLYLHPKQNCSGKKWKPERCNSLFSNTPNVI